MNSISRILSSYIAILLLLTVSCTHRPSPTPEGQTVPDIYEAIPAELHGYILEDHKEILFNIGRLVEYGKGYAQEGDYRDGHKNIVLAIHLLLESPVPDTALDLRESEIEIYKSIANFYTQYVPHAYLDSVPTEISSYVSRFQLQNIIESMDTTGIGETLQLFNECHGSVHYNVPLAYNLRVQQALNATLQSRRKRYIEILLNRGVKYRPFMNEMFEEAGLPTDLTYLPMLESAFNMKAYSHAHASGVWQFIESTGKIFGMRNNYWVDERRDPLKATAGAIAYLRRLHNEFQDWHLALAAYNCGEGRVRRTIRQSGDSSYWDLSLPRETMNYVPLYMAYQIIAKNPQCFGFTVDSTIPPYRFDTVHVSDCIDMRRIASALEIEYDTLRILNPHIKQWCTPPNMKNVTLYLPHGRAEDYKAFYETLTPEDKVNWFRYRVERGDNLGSIARKFNTTVPLIQSINNMRGTTIIAGRYIFVPLSHEDGEAQLARANQPASTPRDNSSQKEDSIRYRVSAGETLFSISRQFNISLEDIQRWNPQINPRALQVGQLITIKGVKESTQTATDQPATTQTASSQPPTIQTATTQTDDTGRESKMDRHTYTVSAGDNLFAISQSLGVSLQDLLKWNNKNPNSPTIHPGERLTYYMERAPEERAAVEKIQYRVASGDTYYGIARNFQISIQELLKANSRNAQETLRVGDILIIPQQKSVKKESSAIKPTITYRIKQGDTLWSIAQLFGISVQEITTASNITVETPLIPGNTLNIPQ